VWLTEPLRRLENPAQQQDDKNDDQDEDYRPDTDEHRLLLPSTGPPFETARVSGHGYPPIQGRNAVTVRGDDRPQHQSSA
jgi:hypothetical protein